MCHLDRCCPYTLLQSPGSYPLSCRSYHQGHNLQIKKSLTLSWRRSLSYRNQSIDLLNTSMDWFLYDNGPRHERVKMQLVLIFVVVSLHFSNLIVKTLQYPQMKVIRLCLYFKKGSLIFLFLALPVLETTLDQNSSLTSIPF